MVTICASSCEVIIPAALTEPCKLTARSGGINRLFLGSCTLDWSLVATAGFWKELVESCKGRITPEVVASLPKATPNKTKIASCRPEVTTSYTYTVVFKDFTDQRDEAGNYADYDFYNFINSKSQQLVFGFFDCEGKFFGPFAKVSLDNSPVIEESSTGTQYWDGTISWIEQQIDKPIDLSAIIPDNTGFPGENVLQYLISNITTTC